MLLRKYLFFLLWPYSLWAYESINLLDNGFANYFPGTYMGYAKDKHDNSMVNHVLSEKPDFLSVYGWVNPSYNASNANHSNLPTGFAIVPNQVEMNQSSLVFQKHLDTQQKDHADFGFKIVNWWGTDYRFSTMQGIFSQQLLQENLLYGYDMPEAFMEFYLPDWGQGSLVTLGRYQARGDVESLLATDNYLVSHSIPYNVSAFTQFGININTMLNDQWSTIVGMHAGSDIAPWGDSAIPTFMGFLKWVSRCKMDSVLFGVSSLNNGQYRNDHDNLQQFNSIWTHRFNGHLYMQTEGYYEYQFNARLGGNSIFGPIEPYGGGLGERPIIPGYSGSIGLMNYLEYGIAERNLISFRADYLNDFQGQRTGYATQYIGVTLGWTHLLADVWKIRPEIRYVTSTSLMPFDNGTQNHLLMGLIDFVVMI